MRLFGKADTAVDRFDRAEWITMPFDRRYYDAAELADSPIAGGAWGVLLGAAPRAGMFGPRLGAAAIGGTFGARLGAAAMGGTFGTRLAKAIKAGVLYGD